MGYVAVAVLCLTVGGLFGHAAGRRTQRAYRAWDDARDVRRKLRPAYRSAWSFTMQAIGGVAGLAVLVVLAGIVFATYDA